MKVKLLAIAAVGKRGQIGLKGDLPWSIPEEYCHFQNTVRGQHVLIGRKNFESHDGDVTGTYPIVLTRNADFKPSNAVPLPDLNEVIAYADKNDIAQIYVIGGAEIYRLTLPFLSEFLLSEVDYDGEADAWFPEFSHLPWTLATEEKHDRWTFRRLVKVPEKI